MNLEKITYNGVGSDTLGIYVSRGSSYDAAAPDYVSYQIPGKNGDLQINNNRYLNIDVSYPVFIPGGFPSTVQAVRNWMRGSNTYARLEDTYDTTHYRMGRGKDILAFTPTVANRGANFELIFDCKPQRWLTSGETASTITNGSTRDNPTQYNALPMFTMQSNTNTAYITVTNTLGTFTMTATTARNYRTIIDCEAMNIYQVSGNVVTNLNANWTGDFPVLAPGTNTFAISGVTSLSVTPRWWEL